MSCLHFLGLLHRWLLLFSFSFSSILPPAFFSPSAVSFLSPATLLYIITPSTIVCSQLIHQCLPSFGPYTRSHPPAISSGWHRASQTQSLPRCPPHPRAYQLNKWHKLGTQAFPVPVVCYHKEEALQCNLPGCSPPTTHSTPEIQGASGAQTLFSPSSWKQDCLQKQGTPITARYRGLPDSKLQGKDTLLPGMQAAISSTSFNTNQSGVFISILLTSCLFPNWFKTWAGGKVLFIEPLQTPHSWQSPQILLPLPSNA